MSSYGAIDSLKIGAEPVFAIRGYLKGNWVFFKEEGLQAMGKSI